MEIPSPWAAYAHQQCKLSQTSRTDTGAAIESALNLILKADFPPDGIDNDVFERAAATAARQDRYRARLRRRYLGSLNSGSDTEDSATWTELTVDGSGGVDDLVNMIEARRQLQRIGARLGNVELSMLLDVAAGVPYDEIARTSGRSAGAIRTRVARIRAMLRSQRDPQIPSSRSGRDPHEMRN